MSYAALLMSDLPLASESTRDSAGKFSTKLMEARTITRLLDGIPAIQSTFRRKFHSQKVRRDNFTASESSFTDYLTQSLLVKIKTRVPKPEEPL